MAATHTLSCGWLLRMFRKSVRLILKMLDRLQLLMEI